MGRLLGEGIKNILTITDPVSGDSIRLYYRIPDTDEKARYFINIWNRDKKTVNENLTLARVQWGSQILEGFKEGSFHERINGEIKDISIDPDHPGFKEDWKEWIKRFAPDILEILCIHVFERGETETKSSQETEESPEKKF
jgi:hypothetical protein